jgi:hypothetical protein
MPSANQRLASLLLGRDVMDWIAQRRDEGASWRKLAAELQDRTNGQVRVSDVALARWRR